MHSKTKKPAGIHSLPIPIRSAHVNQLSGLLGLLGTSLTYAQLTAKSRSTSPAFFLSCSSASHDVIAHTSICTAAAVADINNRLGWIMKRKNEPDHKDVVGEGKNANSPCVNYYKVPRATMSSRIVDSRRRSSRLSYQSRLASSLSALLYVYLSAANGENTMWV